MLKRNTLHTACSTLLIGLAFHSGALGAESPLAKRAAAMQPGTWAELKTEGLTQALTLVTPRKLSIMGWSDDAHWDSRTSQFFFMGFRLQLKFIAYAEKTNAWRELPTFQWPLDKSFGHPYGNNALDRKNGIFFHRAAASPYIHAFDIQKETWSKLPACPFKTKGCGWAIEYFPEMDAILFPYAGGQVYKLDMKTQTWSVMLEGLSFGLHPMIRHNARHGYVLLGGGNKHEKHSYRIDKSGKAERLGEPPVALHVNGTKIVEDTATGDFVVLRGDRFFGYRIDRDQWAPLDDVARKPPSRDGSLICAAIPEYGVSFWMAAPRYKAGRVWLFKYRRPAALDRP